MENLAEKTKNSKLKVLAESMHKANEDFLAHNKSPSRKCGEIDNRGSHYYLIKYWANTLANQTDSKELAEIFTKIGSSLNLNEDAIIKELSEVQGQPVDIGGYYHASVEAASKAMRPSKTLNKIFK
jgi:isocitrate dehydrogenase